MNKIISSNSTSNLSRTYFEIVDRLRSTNSQVQYFESVALTVENGNNKDDNIIILSQIIKYSPNTFILYKTGGNYDDYYITAECSGKAALDIYDQGFDNVTKKNNSYITLSVLDVYNFNILTMKDLSENQNSYMIYLVIRVLNCGNKTIMYYLTLSQPRNINEVIDSDILSSRIMNTTCITRMKLE
ncbi:hypothetical protein H8356DRAFT_1323693 [Neocallimastix lanati (nom. inval.)]|nr:hypothetical protein H8356DRAFT_1323693 [Neocallimastix sp. JGI-2020a]